MGVTKSCTKDLESSELAKNAPLAADAESKSVVVVKQDAPMPKSKEANPDPESNPEEEAKTRPAQKPKSVDKPKSLAKTKPEDMPNHEHEVKSEAKPLKEIQKPAHDDEEKEAVRKPIKKVKLKLPEGVRALGKDSTYEFVEPDHNLHPDAMVLFKKERVLGQGASCEVAHVTRKADGSEFAMKIMKRDDKWNPLLFRQEYDLLTLLDHPNILKYRDCYMDRKNFYICTELCKGGELFDKIKELKMFAEAEAAEIVRTIISAILHCHSKNIVHRDLKPENIVFRTADKKDLVIIDFGDAKTIDENADYEDFVGTAFYLAPECIRKRKGWELKKSDMWTIGVITYVLLTGRPPFYGRDNKQILKKILRAKVVWPKNSKLSNVAKDFVLHLVKKEPLDRFSAEQALQHKWLTGGAGTEDLGMQLIHSLANYSEGSKLKKVLVRMLANDMSDDDHNMLLEQFNNIDLDNDGQIDLADLTKFLQDQGESKQNAELRASQIIQQVDQDKDGKVSIQEFKNAKLARKIGADDRLIRKQFQRIDEDRNGFITPDELSKLFNWTLTEDLIENMIKEIDENNDGKISYEEFVKAMKHGAFETRKHITMEITSIVRKELEAEGTKQESKAEEKADQ